MGLPSTHFAYPHGEEAEGDAHQVGQDVADLKAAWHELGHLQQLKAYSETQDADADQQEVRPRERRAGQHDEAEGDKTMLKGVGCDLKTRRIVDALEDNRADPDHDHDEGDPRRKLYQVLNSKLSCPSIQSVTDHPSPTRTRGLESAQNPQAFDRFHLGE